AAGESRKGEADSEVVAKLKCCRRDLKSRDATINDLRKEISATKCHGIEAEARMNDSETRLKNARADAQRQARMAEQMKSKAMEAQEALSRASRAEGEGKERESKLRVELERLKRQLEVTKAKLEQVTAEVHSLREQEARRAQEEAGRRARKQTTRVAPARRSIAHLPTHHVAQMQRPAGGHRSTCNIIITSMSYAYESPGLFEVGLSLPALICLAR
ncbi:hypothetical protein FOZ63_032904, partial [Perkinsus olseni]